MAETVKKTKATAKPRKTATNKAKTTAPAKKTVQAAQPSRAQIELLARQYWAQRGYTDGYAEQDWLRAEQELLKMAS
jgi:flagellar biosynthesis/type III secretory pathway protein FliH